ncbi:MAG: hypothetical protein K5872_09670 [Rhizobiaceae bacterium]|nr:hypothetical protein [Rhizobiaceae bacterium]MCV0406483.1 hypothetical protein [Rhizobiaceae bacterium]
MSSTVRPRQLPLRFGHESRRSRDDLVVTEANRAAVAVVDEWPAWPSPVVVLAGPAGSGKSHLLSVWSEAAGATRLAPDRLDQARGLSGPVAVDDIDAAPLDQQGLFHLVNEVRAAGTGLLLTARRFPAAWGATLPDLASRLRAATTVEIGEPDDELLAGVIAKLFADRQVDVEPHVIGFLVRRIERSLATAIAVVDRLDRAALEHKTRISRALAASVVTAMDAGQGALDLE